MSKTLKLAKPWGKHPIGTVLTVLAGVDPITPTSVDPKRAATLLADKLATEVVAAPAVSASKPEEKPATAPRTHKPEVNRGQ